LATGPPAFTLVIRDKRAAAALASMDKLAVADAYVDGSLDVEGDFESAFEIRPTLSDRHPLHYAWRFLRPLLFGRTKADAAFIAEHYDNDANSFSASWTRATAAIRRASSSTTASRWKTPSRASCSSRWTRWERARGTGCWTSAGGGGR
jgi:cyclopropane-fatty-acyl-phospholipid synthase